MVTQPRLFEPAQARKAEAWRVAFERAEDDSAHAAWEALATHELIPASWIDAPDRAFSVDVPRHAVCHCARPREPDDHVGAQAHPRTRAGCVALAADVPGVLAAEALARECAGRLALWGVAVAAEVRWREVDVRTQSPPWFFHAPECFTRLARAFAHHGKAFHWGEDALLAGRPGTDDVADAWRASYATCVNLRGVFRGLASDGARVRPARATPLPHAVANKRFRDLPNPFEPAVDIWERGYVLIAIHREAIVLGFATHGADVR